MPFPAISGAEPWTGSKREGNSRSGLRFAEGGLDLTISQTDKGSFVAEVEGKKIRGVAEDIYALE